MGRSLFLQFAVELGRSLVLFAAVDLRSLVPHPLPSAVARLAAMAFGIRGSRSHRGVSQSKPPKNGTKNIASLGLVLCAAF